MNTETPSVALYWDFENIHASLVDRTKGTGFYRQNRFMPQEPLVDVQALMEFAVSLGSVAINCAYGNWQWLARYREALLHSAIELIQLFPPGANAKNGADIKLCLDAAEDIIRFPHISTIVIFGGTATSCPSPRRSRPLERFSSASGASPRPTGTGLTPATNSGTTRRCWSMRRCPPRAPPWGPLPRARHLFLPDAGDLIRRAIARLSANKGDPWVLKAAIRPMVKRLDSTFDEKTFGVATFAELLKKHADLFEAHKGQNDHEHRILQPTMDRATGR